MTELSCPRRETQDGRKDSKGAHSKSPRTNEIYQFCPIGRPARADTANPTVHETSEKGTRSENNTGPRRGHACKSPKRSQIGYEKRLRQDIQRANKTRGTELHVDLRRKHEEGSMTGTVIARRTVPAILRRGDCETL